MGILAVPFFFSGLSFNKTFMSVFLDIDAN